MNSQNQNIDLRTHGVLVTVNISSYSGSRLDRDASAEIAEDKGSSAAFATDAYRVNKVVYNKKFLKPVGRISLNFYKWLRERSHQWSHGVYLIKAETLNEVLTEFQKAKVNWIRELDNLCSDALRREALEDYRERTGNGFDESIWPTVDDLKEAFTFNLDIEQLPDPQTADNLVFKIGSEAAERIAESTAKKLADKSAEVSKETARRIGEVVQKMVDKLTEKRKDADGNDLPPVFRDTLVSNLREAVELIDTLNVTGDPALDKLKADILRDLCPVDPADLRKDPAVRKDTVKKAKAISSKLAKFSRK